MVKNTILVMCTYIKKLLIKTVKQNSVASSLSLFSSSPEVKFTSPVVCPFVCKLFTFKVHFPILLHAGIFDMVRP